MIPLNLKSLYVFLVMIFPQIIFADSPLTSTPFHEKYTDVETVNRALHTGLMNEEFAEYLHDSSNPLEIKAALINALGWNFDGKNNAAIYNEIIYGRALSESNVSNVKTGDLFVLGYLMAMDDYQNVNNAYIFLREARRKDKESYTIAIIYGLVKAQKVMDTDFCRSWKYADKVFTNEDLEFDMRKEAVKVIYDYMVIYKDYCKGN